MTCQQPEGKHSKWPHWHNYDISGFSICCRTVGAEFVLRSPKGYARVHEKAPRFVKDSIMIYHTQGGQRLGIMDGLIYGEHVQATFATTFHAQGLGHHSTRIAKHGRIWTTLKHDTPSSRTVYSLTKVNSVGWQGAITVPADNVDQGCHNITKPLPWNASRDKHQQR